MSSSFHLHKGLPLLFFITTVSAFPNLVFAHELLNRADSHAPIGVMGDHMHKAGEFMFSYRHMEMSMSGNLQGRDTISDEDIVTSVENTFGMPQTLRIVPQNMTTKMDMFGFMYAPTDKITLMIMLNHISKDMELTTYDGIAGTEQRGNFNTSPSGLGDTKVSALVSLHDSVAHKIHLNVGLSIPTGSIDETGEVLAPLAAADGEVTLPYAMQLGSGTYDLEPGITYTGFSDKQSWRAQYKAIIRTGENDAEYTLGNQHEIQAWGQYLFTLAVSSSIRISAKTLDSIDGMDARIAGPVQTADPSNYGGDYLNAGIGINYYGQSGLLKNHRLAAEYSVPLIQDVNGVQMEMDNMFTLGYQYAF